MATNANALVKIKGVENSEKKSPRITLEMPNEIAATTKAVMIGGPGNIPALGDLFKFWIEKRINICICRG